MAHVLEEVPTKGELCVVPDNGDMFFSQPILAMMQPVTNRVAWCERAIDTTGGNHPIKVEAALADLTAVAAPATGDVRLVTGYGLFRFTAGDTTTPFSPWVVTHASGRWIHVTYSSIADNTGGALLATLVNGKLPLARHSNALLRTTRTDYHGVVGTVIASTSDASYIGVAVSHLDLALAASDEVLIEAAAWVSAGSLFGTAYACLRTSQDWDGTPTAADDASTEVQIVGDVPRLFVFRKRLVITDAGNCKVQLALHGDGTSTARLHRPSYVSTTVIRP